MRMDRDGRGMATIAPRCESRRNLPNGRNHSRQVGRSPETDGDDVATLQDSPVLLLKTEFLMELSINLGKKIGKSAPEH